MHGSLLAWFAAAAVISAGNLQYSELFQMQLQINLYATAVLQKFEVLTTPINLSVIREKIVMFIVLQIIDQKGEFRCRNKQYDE